MNKGSINISDSGSVQITPVNGEVWLSQTEIAQAFEVFPSAINANVRAIVKAKILDLDDVMKIVPLANGSFREVYNMTMITALAYRISSRKFDAYRIWIARKLDMQTNSGEKVMTRLLNSFSDNN